MSQFAFKQSLSPPGMLFRSRHDAGLVGKSTGRTRGGKEGAIGTEGNLGWYDIKSALAGTVIKQTVPGPHQKTRRYESRFTLANREADYRVAWNFFDRPQRESTNVAAQTESRP